MTPAAGSANESVTAFAPATVANVGPGFDLLGFAMRDVGDTVTLSRTDAAAGTVALAAVEGPPELVSAPPETNTAVAALRALFSEHPPPGGIEIRLAKGIPLASGMGGSAASAVGAVVAANELLKLGLSPERLLPFALAGETAASGDPHPDNAAPCLLGGLVLAGAGSVVRIPVPDGVHCVLVHPHVQVPTREARAALESEVSLIAHVQQSGYLAGLLAGCFGNDLDLVRRHLTDVIVEPQRARLIPGFETVKQAALDTGAIGCSISGSGPSLFAWADSAEAARRIGTGMTRAFLDAGLATDAWVSDISGAGAPGSRCVT